MEQNKNLKKCTITIIEENNIRNVVLSDFNDPIISFGRDERNDIVIDSPFVSHFHGYFEIVDGNVMVVDKKSTNGIYVNNNKQDRTILKDGDSIKIDNPSTPLQRGVIMIFIYGEVINEWQQFDLNKKEVVTIGRDYQCDIVLNHVSVLLNHAKISRKNDSFVLSPMDSASQIIINGKLLRGEVTLHERDVILISNAKLVYNKGRILYQLYEKGVTLEAIDVGKTVLLKRKKKEILQHADLLVEPGEFVAFIGGSGAGKSTFMNCISGISKPTNGQVLVNGNDLFENYSVLKNIIGYVPQQDIVYTDLTLIDMLRYAANLRMPDDASLKEKEKRITEVLNIVELIEKKDVMIRNLSGGQRKRASIAVELIADPKLFFLDEPTSGLDPGTERSMMKTLRKMADQGKTVILVTHNTLNLHLCDKVVFMGNGGKVCFAGNPNEALSFFGVTNFVDIYNLITDDVDRWYIKYNNSNFKEQHEKVPVTQKIGSFKNKRSFFKQFLTLARRYAKTIFNNKQQLFMLLLQGPLCAFLLSLVVNDKTFQYYDETKTLLFAVATTAIWLGLLNSIQEICKEKVILRKEYMANLKLTAYLASKVAVLVFLSLIQAFLLVGTLSLLVDVPSDGIIYGWFTETVIVCFLTIISASSLGLIVSCLVKSPSVAMSFAPILLVPQLLFSKLLFPLEGNIELISNFILCRWTVEALGTSNDLNSLVTYIQDIVPNYPREVEDAFLFTSSHFYEDLIVIIGMTVILVIICYLILRNRLESSD